MKDKEEKKECCEKCKSWDGLSYNNGIKGFVCSNHWCSCHPTPTDKEKWWEDYTKHTEWICSIQGICQTAGQIIFLGNAEKNKDKRKEYRKARDAQIKRLKQFVDILLSSAEQRGREEARKEMEKEYINNLQEIKKKIRSYHCGYHSLLLRFIDKLLTNPTKE